jgi:hypothetical protein
MEINEQRKIAPIYSFKKIMLFGYLVLLLGVSIVPQLDYLSRIVFLGAKTELMYGLMMIIIFLNSKELKYEVSLILLSMFWMLSVIVNAFIAGDYYYQLFFPTAIILLLYSYFYTVSINDRNKEIYRKIAYLFLIISIFTGISGIRALSIDSFASRYLASSNIDVFYYYSKMGAVGYDYIYGFSILSPVMIGYIFDKSLNKKVRIMISIAYIVNVLLLFKANFSTAIIIYIFGIILIFIFKIKNKVFGTLFLLLALLLYLLIDIKKMIHFFIIIFLEYLEPIIPSYTFNKILSITDILSGNGLSGTIDIRHNKLVQNMEIISNNLLFGNAFSDQRLKVGEHAEFLDLLASGGIFGFILYMAFLLIIIRNIYKLFKRVNFKPFILSSLTLVLIIGSVNNLFRAADIPLFIFIILPSLAFIKVDYSNKGIS